MNDSAAQLPRIPSVDTALKMSAASATAERFGRSAVAAAVRLSLDELRAGRPAGSAGGDVATAAVAKPAADARPMSPANFSGDRRMSCLVTGAAPLPVRAAWMEREGYAGYGSP